MIGFKDYKKFTIDELNIVDPDSLPMDLNLRVFGVFNVLRRVRDKKIMVLLPRPERRPANWKKYYSERVSEISTKIYRGSKVNLFTTANTLCFYSSRNALKFLEIAGELDIDDLRNDSKAYEYLDPRRKIIISR
jgi:hypothetical protein